MTLSFAPLDETIPACNRLLASGDLTDERRIDALWARAQAYQFALTYHLGHSIDGEDLMNRALADLTQAVTLVRELPRADLQRLTRVMRERAGVLHSLGRYQEVAEDYTAVLEMLGETDPPSLVGRARAYMAMGNFEAAISDMDTVVRVTEDAGNQQLWVYLRGEIHEAAGNREAAIADYRRTLELQSEHGGAAQALKRFGAGP